MVKVEVNYNPYLKETAIKFNGQKPKINSIVEKYQQDIIQTWINKMPVIFYDEMNGYDFELEFSGTKTDCEDVEQAFRKAGVSEKQVKVFHKNELDCRTKKVIQIEKLLQWLKENRNGKFGYDVCVEENAEFFKGENTCIMINGRCDVNFPEYKISVEVIENVNELDNTELLYTPLLLWVDNENVNILKHNIEYFLSRKDVCQEQIFFIIHPSLNAVAIERIIKDLGVIAPQIISSATDELVRKYLETFPVSNYIYKAIRLFRQQETEIKKQLDVENEQILISNREVHNHIDVLEENIKRLKMAEEKFDNRDNFELTSAMWDEKANLINSIKSWRNKKIKIAKENEANELAQEFEIIVRRAYTNFNNMVVEISEGERKSIEMNYKEWYQEAKFDEQYIPVFYYVKKLEDKLLPAFVSELMEMKEERYVSSKEDLFGLFFKSSNDKETERVLEISYNCQEWRKYAIEIIEPIANEIIREYEELLKKYSTELASKYQLHIAESIKEQTDIKEEVSAQLSDEELKLQVDNDWFVEFQDQLRVIERG